VLFNSPVADGLGVHYLTAVTFPHSAYLHGDEIDKNESCFAIEARPAGYTTLFKTYKW